MAYLTAAKQASLSAAWKQTNQSVSVPAMWAEVAAAIAADILAVQAAHVADAAAATASAGAAPTAGAVSITAVDTALAAVTGVDGTGNNAASKADVDARLVTQEAFNDQVIVDLGEVQTEVAAAVADTAALLAEYDLLLADVAALRTTLNAVIGAMETAGLMATS